MRAKILAKQKNVDGINRASVGFDSQKQKRRWVQDHMRSETLKSIIEEERKQGLCGLTKSMPEL